MNFLGDTSLGFSIPLIRIPVVSGLFFGVEVEATAYSSGAGGFLYGGGGLVCAASVRGSSKNLGDESIFSRSRGTFLKHSYGEGGGWSGKFAASIPLLPLLGLKGGHLMTESGDKSSVGVAAVAGASASATFGGSTTFANPFLPQGVEPCN
jgi:hypothetical protein